MTVELRRGQNQGQRLRSAAATSPRVHECTVGPSQTFDPDLPPTQKSSEN
jgi:hypothetical protein